MSTDTLSHLRIWTVTDLSDRFGALPAHRIRNQPAPGTATEADVLLVHRREKRACELVDGVLLEKTVGFLEAYYATHLAALLWDFVRPRGLGVVVGPDGMQRLAPGLVRIPDVSFLSWDRLPGGQLPRQPIPDVVPNLAVEILSESNTQQEIDRKLRDYFTHGVQLVWLVDPRRETVEVFVAVDQHRMLTGTDILDGGEVLPGFKLALAELFADPRPKS